jgi:hypothetical protein
MTGIISVQGDTFETYGLNAFSETNKSHLGGSIVQGCLTRGWEVTHCCYEAH